jgi:hypothetical protein
MPVGALAVYQLGRATFAVGWWWPGEFGKPGGDVRLPSPRAAHLRARRCHRRCHHLERVDGRPTLQTEAARRRDAALGWRDEVPAEPSSR